MTTLLWAIFLYLIRGFFIWVAEQASALTGQHALADYFRALEPSVFDPSVLSTFMSYIAVIIVQSAVLIGWGLYNQFRFRGKERRGQRQAITVADLGALYEFSAEEVERWQGARSMIMHHDEAGKLLHTEIATSH